MMTIIPVVPEDSSPNANAFALRFSLLDEAADRIAYVDVGAEVTTVYPSLASDQNARDLVSQSLRALEAQGFSADVNWTLGSPLAWTFNEYCAAFEELAGQIGQSGLVQSVMPLPNGHLEVGVTEYADLRALPLAAAQERYPGMIDAMVSEGLDIGASHRANDTDGFNAGDAIQTFSGGRWIDCSAAFKIQNAQGVFLLTAAHCSNGNAQPVRNGTNLCWNGLSGFTSIGTTASRILGSNGDFAVIRPTAATTGHMWLGSRCLGSAETGVLGAVASSSGSRVGFSGHNSGQTTGTVMSSVTGCHNITYGNPINQQIAVCNLYSASPTPSPSLVIGGDSGGPVFAYTANQNVYGAGIIVAYNQDTNQARYMSLPRVLEIYGASIVTS